MKDPEKKVLPLEHNGKKSVLNKENETLPKENIVNKITDHKTNTINSINQKSNIKLSESQEENKKKVKNPKKLNNSKTKYLHETNEQKYIIKIINFVAIKVAVDQAPAPAKRRRSIVKKVDEKPPRPVDKPPSLPKEEL